MAAAVPLRADYDAPLLRGLARSAVDPGQVRRLLALAAIYAGEPRSAAAAIGGVGLQTVRDWVMRFNAHGPGIGMRDGFKATSGKYGVELLVDSTERISDDLSVARCRRGRAGINIGALVTCTRCNGTPVRDICRKRCVRSVLPQLRRIRVLTWIGSLVGAV